jgi:hypothetical protein
VGAGAATVLETELTATGIPHNPEGLPGAKHTFINDQLRAGHRRAFSLDSIHHLL